MRPLALVLASCQLCSSLLDAWMSLCQQYLGTTIPGVPPPGQCAGVLPECQLDFFLAAKFERLLPRKSLFACQHVMFISCRKRMQLVLHCLSWLYVAKDLLCICSNFRVHAETTDMHGPMSSECICSNDVLLCRGVCTEDLRATGCALHGMRMRLVLYV